MLLGASNIFAHRPYDVPAGSLHRSDGVRVAILKHYTDGILGPDPCSIIFRAPDNSTIATTPPATDSVVWVRGEFADVFEFLSGWVPIASRMYRFDGHSVTKLATSKLVWISPLIHVAGHWLPYLLSTLLLTVSGVGLLADHRRRTLRHPAARGLSRVTLVVLGFFGLAIAVLSPASPFIIAAIAAAAIMTSSTLLPVAKTSATDNPSV